MINENLTLDDVLKAVSEIMHISEEDLKKNCRHRPITEARQIAFHLSRRYTKYTLAAIGHFYNRHHTTVIYGCEQVDYLMSSYRKYRQKYNQAKQILLFDSMERESVG